MDTTENKLPSSRLFPSIRWSIMLVLAMLVATVVLSIMLAAVWTIIIYITEKPSSFDLQFFEEMSASFTIPTYLITTPVVFGSTIGLIYYVNRKSSLTLIPIKKFTLHQLPCTLVITIGALIISSEIQNMTSQLVPFASFFDEAIAEFLVFTPGAIFAVCIIAPLSEEFLFRGCLLRTMITKHKKWTSILVSAVLFGFFHINPGQIPYAFFIGLVLGWLYYKTSSVWLCIIAHMINNMTTFLAIYMAENNMVDIPGFISPDMFETTSNQPLWLTGLGMMALAVGLFLLQKNTSIQDSLMSLNKTDKIYSSS
ncbi:MAG: type II CAAX endopeptidase family protein [Bacteroidota bacterium]